MVLLVLLGLCWYSERLVLVSDQVCVHKVKARASPAHPLSELPEHHDPGALERGSVID
jgi:hypothetical protein